MKINNMYAVAIYAVIAILVFGYARNHQASWHCETKTNTWCKSDENLSHGVGSVLDGLFWPMYLSYKAFEPAAPQSGKEPT